MFEIADYQSFIGGVASTLTIIVAGFGFYRWLAERSKKLFVDSLRNDFGAKNLPRSFSVEFNSNGKSGSTAVVDYHFINNRSAISITDDDFVQPIRIARIDEGVIYYANIHDSNASGDASLRESDDGIRLHNLFIPRQKGLILEVAHDGCLSRQVQSSPKSLPDLKLKQFKSIFDKVIPIIPIAFLAVCIASLRYAADAANNSDYFVIYQYLPIIISLFCLLIIMQILDYGVSRHWKISKVIIKAFGTSEIEFEFMTLKYRVEKMVRR